MTYAKLKQGVLQNMRAPKNISNPTEAQLAAYAAAKGYKALQTDAAPSPYHGRSYTETEDAIITVWTAPDLDALKAIKKSEAEREKEQALLSSTNIPVEGIGEVVYNQDALINIMGLVLAQADSASYVLADDSIITLNHEQIAQISQVLSAHRTGIYAAKAARFAAIDACEDIEELLK